MNADEMYDQIINQQLSGSEDSATEFARQLWNLVVSGKEFPQRPPFPESLCNQHRSGYPVLSGLAVLCRGINRLLKEKALGLKERMEAFAREQEEQAQIRCPACNHLLADEECSFVSYHGDTYTAECPECALEFSVVENVTRTYDCELIEED